MTQPTAIETGAAPGLAGERVELQAVRDAITSFGYAVSDQAAGPGTAGEENAEYKALLRKFWVAAILSVPVLVIAMGHGHIPALDFLGVNWVQLALTTPVVFYSGSQFFRGAAFRHRAADMNTLIASRDRGAAYLYSVAATFFPGGFLATDGRCRCGWRQRTRVLRSRRHHRGTDHPRPTAGVAGKRANL